MTKPSTVPPPDDADHYEPPTWQDCDPCPRCNFRAAGCSSDDRFDYCLVYGVKLPLDPFAAGGRPDGWPDYPEFTGSFTNPFEDAEVS